MEIRKLFKLNNVHIVRNCYSERCKHSLHAHTAEIEVFLKGIKVDNAGMIMDFGVTKTVFKPFLDIHQNAVLIWKYDSDEYKDFVKSKTDNWIELAFTPSAELLAAYFQLKFSSFLNRLELANNEDPNITISKTRYHETRTGYAEATGEDVFDLMVDQRWALIAETFGPIPSKKLSDFYNKNGFYLLSDNPIPVPKPEHQVVRTIYKKSKN